MCVSRKLPALLLCLCMCFLCFGLLGLVRTMDQPSKLCNQPYLVGRVHLNDRLSALTQWVKTRSASCSLLVRRGDGCEEVVHMDRTGIGARVHLVRIISCAQTSLILVGYLRQVTM